MFHSSNAPANSSWQAFSCRGPRKAAIGKVNALVLSWLFSISVSVAQSNVVFIFVDDFGWGDVNAYRELFGFTPNLDDKDGNSITPNMDALAAQGTLFTEGYVASPVCTPSRVGVLTGIEPPRFGLHDFLNSKNANDSRNMNDWLDPHTMTAPRWFQNAGYATGLFGKWHMGGGRDVNDAPFPQEYGFEESLTSFEGMGDRILYLDNGNTHGLSNQNADVPGSIEWVEWELGADKHTDAAISFIQNAVSQNEPFFIFVPHDDTHAPYDTDPGKEEDFDHVAGMANNTTGKLFLSELNELDKEIGRLVNAIDTLGVGGETLIVLVGDNGAPVGGINDTLMRNGDLRGGKKRLWEGGIREPFLVRMPGTVPANAVNTTTAVSTLDLFPTFCSMAGLPLPDVPFGGEDMWDVFTGSTRPRVKPLYWEFATNPNIDAAGPKLAMREGHLKLMMDPDGTDRYLFDLSTNRQEADSGNLINTPSFADTVNSMEVRLLTWYQEVMFGVTNTPDQRIVELFEIPEGGKSVRLFWTTSGMEWMPPQVSSDLLDWNDVAFTSKDAEIDFGTLKWLEIDVTGALADRAFFRGPPMDPPPGLENETGIYLIFSSGEIRQFSGISAGLLPVEGNDFADGELATTVSAYGAYQGFTQLPDDRILGVSGSGDVHEWSGLSSWLAADAPAVLSTGAYQSGELHGLSYDAATGGVYVIYEGDNSSRDDGDLGEYATVTDFVNDASASVTASNYGGNILNFYYPGEDAVGNDNDANAGSNYFHVSGSGNLEGWLTLADYTVNKTGANGREFLSTGYADLIGGFAIIEGNPIYFVSSTGQVRRFTGIGGGATPVLGNSLGDGELVATVASYGSYQGFTQIPGGQVYGVAANGNVHEWSNLASWLAGDSPSTVSTGAYQSGELHGLSYDPATGGVYVIYEGDNSARGDGDLGEYASVTDFVNDASAAVTASIYNGNILNFHYPGNDAPGNDNDANAGSKYFQASGSGVVEGWLTLADYTVNKTGANGREFVQSGYADAVGAFAEIP